jgi:polyribonucleotide nucleotidyltransferase
LIPIRIEDFEPQALEYHLGIPQWVDFYSERRSKGEHKLRKLVSDLLGRPGEAQTPGSEPSHSRGALQIYTTKIPANQIGDLIGPGGTVIRGIIEHTGVKIDVEDDGTVHVASNDPQAAKKALQIIDDLTATAEVGKTYLGKVVRILDFGAFVELFPGTDGLLHISRIAENRVKEVRDELLEGANILVKVIRIEGNKIILSRKAVLREQREKLKHGRP